MTYRSFATLLLLPGLAAQANSAENDARVEELYSQAKAAQSQGDLRGAIGKY